MKRADQPRDQQTGQFAFDNNFDRMCTCGHALGFHIHGGFDCMVGTGCKDDPNPPRQFCECKKFRQSRATPPRVGARGKEK